ncbi:GCN5-related N-acetyltransferas-like protein [Westerdykella ornata]|uniref:GCN5-related N-acetyltransferas-like protein n=1 Tax=Westerdykella ornata TaxID=318751 RepID=A0A6A6JC52_WESOR|nr:GCN5-related N-acetyltransferas-like protein [Westerdykella ornata]KAF2274012.1 GCN5-related N-acetyltransferas-like protein [Westerdykella ornata]
MPQPFIRPYDPSRDLDACIHIFYATLDPAVDFEPARTIGSFLWCRAYLLLSPETCFVLDDGTIEGRAVGYIIGTADTNVFATKWKNSFLPNLGLDPEDISRENGKEPASSSAELTAKLSEEEKETVRSLQKTLQDAECSMIQPFPALLSQFPAHLHIDVLPAYQNQGWGPKLMGTFLEEVKRLGARGVHLGMVRGNHRAKKFYERLGWRLCEEVLDRGKSGEVGRKDEAICLLRAL